MGSLTTYIAYSGGFDSTYYLWKWLKENPPSKGQSILVHHVYLHNARKKVEGAACDTILALLKKQGMSNFHYIKTVFSRGNIRGRIFDLDAIGIMSGFVLTNHGRNVNTVLGCYCAEESTNIISMLNSGMTMRKIADTSSFRSSIFIRHIEYITQKRYDYVSPYIRTKKADMIKELPMDIRNAVWYCRTPTKQGMPCGTCFNCKRCFNQIQVANRNDMDVVPEEQTMVCS